MTNYGRWGAPSNVPRTGAEKPTPAASATIEDKNEKHHMYDREVVERIIDTPASIGLSVSVGRSAPYAVQKYEIACWSTLPAPPDGESRDIAFAEAKKEVYRNLQNVLSEVCETFGLDHPTLKNQ